MQACAQMKSHATVFKRKQNKNLPSPIITRYFCNPSKYIQLYIRCVVDQERHPAICPVTGIRFLPASSTRSLNRASPDRKVLDYDCNTVNHFLTVIHRSLLF
ncbi:Hypothetical predicted protein [Cloeon dipterum]|uniref:Uncharacterized protein n=1 Tax=Cloeon dipterum TaxID=197152 RepID=A0A8S1DR00_9INSE|nr:Hypothetical predicted protein [Cloeon dipterum]